jgi:hypothetical protein
MLPCEQTINNQKTQTTKSKKKKKKKKKSLDTNKEKEPSKSSYDACKNKHHQPRQRIKERRDMHWRINFAGKIIHKKTSRFIAFIRQRRETERPMEPIRAFPASRPRSSPRDQDAALRLLCQPAN